jgi:NADPH2:quinone reductase
MRAVRVVRHGDPAEAIEVGDDVEVPEPGPGQVRVAVAAASRMGELLGRIVPRI